jgi:membrane protease YdiL (CAAX protease family)
MKQKKHLAKLITTFLLLIPLVLGVHQEFLFVTEIDHLIIIVIISGILLLIGLGKLIEIFGFNNELMKAMKKHEILKAFAERNIQILFIWFPITIIMEEFLFRYYLAGFFFLHFEYFLALSVASLLFGLYHIHIWFYFKNAKLSLIFVLFSTMLGVVLNLMLYYLGIFFCFALHYCLVLWIYRNIYKRYY